MKLLDKILSTDDTKRKWTAVGLTVIITGFLLSMNKQWDKVVALIKKAA